MPQILSAAVGPHVAVLAFPFGTHAAPLLAVIHRIATISPTIHFSFLNTQRSNSSIFSVHSYKMQPNVKAYDVWDGVPEGYVFEGKPQEDTELFLKAAAESFKKGMDAAVAETGRKVTCLVTDAFFWFAAEMAVEMKAVWVPFWTAGPSALSAHIYTDFLREKIGAGEREDEFLDSIPGMSKIKIGDLPEGVVFGNLESLFSDMLHKMGLTLPQAATVLMNSFEEVDPIITNDLKSKFKKFLNIGPLHLISPPPAAQVPDMHGCIPWLDRQKLGSAAYVSFGSVITLPPPEILALAEALEATKVPFLWSLRDDLKVHLPKGFLERTKLHGMVVPWAPQLDVLAHSGAGVFITHCGWNSLMESIAGGVPLICRPFFGDQRLNARMVGDVWEIGVIVEGGAFTKNGVVNGLDKIFSQEYGNKFGKNVRALQQLAIKAIEPEGSSANNFIALSDLLSGLQNC